MTAEESLPGKPLLFDSSPSSENHSEVADDTSIAIKKKIKAFLKQGVEVIKVRKVRRESR
ncbi:MAG: hypothetical protein GWO20_10640 [Candidatus Korarchaeota archaeon]|nr:hypothetical protein [Candidatus Korarchaeota archaeon]NIU83941.1 hypothetical protein [Candidatus Thorarchaeota archaeon]NIW14069.1 hypothetical protein [Candidatus Thorarchaeota archaeon]NIW52179.1 hypothetical protein [Candidatus Korarchaeota archaeon]